MRQAILEIPLTALDFIFIKQPENSELHLEIVHALPADAKFVSCHYDLRNRPRVFQLVYESSEFAELSEGDRMPVLPPIEFTRIDYVIPQYEP